MDLPRDKLGNVAGVWCAQTLGLEGTCLIPFSLLTRELWLLLPRRVWTRHQARGPLSPAYLMAGYRRREELDRGAWVMDMSGLGCRKSQKEECPEKHRHRRCKDYGHTMCP